MADDFSEPQGKTPFRFWLLGMMAVLTMIFTLLWMASLFSGCDFSKKDTTEDGGRMLRPM